MLTREYTNTSLGEADFRLKDTHTKTGGWTHGYQGYGKAFFEYWISIFYHILL